VPPSSYGGVHRTTWKKGEQTLAHFFSTTRTPLSGGNSKATRSDTLHPKLYFEMKKGKYVPRQFSGIVELYRTTEARAEKEKKLPVLVLRPAGTCAPTAQWMAWVRLTHLGIPHDMVVSMSLGDLREFLGMNGLPEPAQVPGVDDLPA